MLTSAVCGRMYQAQLKANKFVVPLQTVAQLVGLSGQQLTDWLALQPAVVDADALDVDATKKAVK